MQFRARRIIRGSFTECGRVQGPSGIKLNIVDIIQTIFLLNLKYADLGPRANPLFVNFVQNGLLKILIDGNLVEREYTCRLLLHFCFDRQFGDILIANTPLQDEIERVYNLPPLEVFGSRSEHDLKEYCFNILFETNRIGCTYNKLPAGRSVFISFDHADVLHAAYMARFLMRNGVDVLYNSTGNESVVEANFTNKFCNIEESVFFIISKHIWKVSMFRSFCYLECD